MMKRRKICIFLGQTASQVLVCMVSAPLLSCQLKKVISEDNQSAKGKVEIINESGDFLNEVSRLKKLALPKDSNLYQPPTPNDLEKFSRLAKALILQDINEVLNKANALNYDLVRFIDSPSRQVFYGLREKIVRDRPLRGWGSYFINMSYTADALVEVPHIIFDRFTEEIGAKVFRMSAARGFLLAGAHRNANGPETADVCNPIESIFQEVHKAWILSKNKTWQIHGFSLSTKPNFPADTQCVLSDGRGTVSAEVSDLSLRMQARNFKTYVYNRPSASTPLNLPRNRGLASRTFSHLGGTQNWQGIYCRSVGTAFTHIELEESIRYNSTNRDLVSEVIANSIQAVS